MRLGAPEPDVDHSGVSRFSLQVIGLHLRGAIPPGTAPRAAFGSTGGGSAVPLGLVYPFPGITTHVVQAVDPGRRLPSPGMAMTARQVGTMAPCALAGSRAAIAKTLRALGRIASRVRVAAPLDKTSGRCAALFGVSGAEPLRIGWQTSPGPSAKGLRLIEGDVNGRLIVGGASRIATKRRRPGPAGLVRPSRLKNGTAAVPLSTADAARGLHKAPKLSDRSLGPRHAEASEGHPVNTCRIAGAGSTGRVSATDRGAQASCEQQEEQPNSQRLTHAEAGAYAFQGGR